MLHTLHGVRSKNEISGSKPLGQLSLQGNVSKNWKDWIRAYKLYALAAELRKKNEDVQCTTFLHVAGPAIQEIHASMTLFPEDQDKVSPLTDKFQAFCEPKKNVIVSWYQFDYSAQRNGENFDCFFLDLCSLAKYSEYDKLEESLITLFFVCLF